jgi:S1-C subfamily serine protease
MRAALTIVAIVTCVGLCGCVPIVASGIVSNEADQRLIGLIRETGAVPDDRAGVAGMVVDSNGTVVTVVYGGPAYLAQIRPGDTVVAADGQPLVGMPGSTLKLRVESGGAAREVEIVRVPWWAVFDVPPPPDAKMTTPGG